MVILDGLESFLALLGRSWGDLGRSWGVLRRSLPLLGWSWGGLGRSDRNRLGQKIDKKSDQHLRWPPEAILNRFGVVWGSIWDGFGVDLGKFGVDLRGFAICF